MADWREELSRWLAPFLAKLSHKARRRMTGRRAAAVAEGARTQSAALTCKDDDHQHGRAANLSRYPGMAAVAKGFTTPARKSTIRCRSHKI
jgi:hypothetical protein